MLAVTGCSYVFETYNFTRDGALYFGLVPGQDLPNSGTDANCIQSAIVAIVDAENVDEKSPDGTIVNNYQRATMWHYDGPQGKCSLKFPFKYGDAPASRTSKVAARPLQAGVTYRLNISSREGGFGSHLFELKAEQAP
jgi:hypothetical protein